MQTNLSIDAEAAEFLSQIVDGLGPSSGERRHSERRPFPSIQNVAPVKGDGLPPAFAFGPVHCHDLSQTGLSFYWPVKPAFESVVIALSNGIRTMYFLARVRHSHEGFCNSQRHFLVGCEFQCRVRYPHPGPPEVKAALPQVAYAETRSSPVCVKTLRCKAD